MKQKKVIYIVFLISIVLLVFLAISSGNSDVSLDGTNQDADKQDLRKDKVPNVSLKDNSGNEVALSSFEGKPYVINSWATWCPFCVDELPDFVLLQEEFDEEIVVIGVNRQESVEKTENFLASIDLELNDLVFLYDEDDDFYRRIGGFSMPETLFVDADGNIVLHKRGFMEIDEMREIVEKMINS